uniref:Uncharacterized protein n=1 Tax=Vespula pensylvanica TaxID=30213 RepID=A0A834NSF4_VESPE|nr:hypothetical protein H0235_011695 [Vespula pensylvanica]
MIAVMPKSHRVEVAASGDPRANGDSTLKSTIRDAFPLRELRASQQTGDSTRGDKLSKFPESVQISKSNRGDRLRKSREGALVEIQSKTEPVSVKVGQSSNVVVVTECVLRELPCPLVEIQSKTEPVTVKVGQSSNVVVITGGKASPLLDVNLEQNNLQCVLRELPCPLFEIQSKTEPVTVKVGQSSNVVVVTGGRSMRTTRTRVCTSRNLNQDWTSNCQSQSKAPLCFRYGWESIPTSRCNSRANKTGPVTVKVSQRPHYVSITGGKASPLLDVILEQSNLCGILKE